MTNFSRITHVCIPRDRIEDMVRDLVSKADYDIAKELDPGSAEDPDDAEDFMQEFVDIIEEYGD